LNLAIKGIRWKAGDSAVVSVMEHNSVLRPLHALEERVGIKVHKVKASAEGVVDSFEVAKRIDSHTKLIALVHASNVIGTLQPVAEVGQIARNEGIPFLVDAAQSAGAYPIDVQAMNIDLLAFPGHKALLGPLGTGGLYIREGLELDTLKKAERAANRNRRFSPIFCRTATSQVRINALGIAGWKAGLEYILGKRVTSIRTQEES